jgi:hypothetical protein
MDNAASLKDTLTVGRERHPCKCIFETSSRGSFTGNSTALWSAYMLLRCSMTMEDGKSFKILITGFKPGRTELRFKVS